MYGYLEIKNPNTTIAMQRRRLKNLEMTFGAIEIWMFEIRQIWKIILLSETEGANSMKETGFDFSHHQSSSPFSFLSFSLFMQLFERGNSPMPPLAIYLFILMIIIYICHIFKPANVHLCLAFAFGKDGSKAIERSRAQNHFPDVSNRDFEYIYICNWFISK